MRKSENLKLFQLIVDNGFICVIVAFSQLRVVQQYVDIRIIERKTFFNVRSLHALTSCQAAEGIKPSVSRLGSPCR